MLDLSPDDLPPICVAAVRAQLGLDLPGFAKLYSIPLATAQYWEALGDSVNRPVALLLRLLVAYPETTYTEEHEAAVALALACGVKANEP